MPVFFGKSWINKVIEFNTAASEYTAQWQIVRKVNELCHQEDEEGWEERDREPYKSIAVFECVNPLDINESAFMKIYMQFVYLPLYGLCVNANTANTRIPYLESEHEPAEDRAQQATPNHEIVECEALQNFDWEWMPGSSFAS